MIRSETTAQGYFTYAEAYAISARKLCQTADSIPHGGAPARLLAFLAVELYLKATLRCLGRSSQDLAGRPFGHDLGELARACQQELQLTQEDMIALSDKRMSASAMQSRYIAPSAPDKLIVEPEVLCGLAERIRNALLAHPICVGKIIEFGEGARV